MRCLLGFGKYPDLLPNVSVHYGAGPSYKHFDYYNPATNTIYWLGGDDPYGFLHEVGHAYDAQFLSRDDRRALRALLPGPPRRWFWGDWDPETHTGKWGPMCEAFADAYARAQLHRLRGRRFRRALRNLRKET